MPASIQELLLAYARLGIDHWRNTSPRVKNKARKIGVDIASNQEAATRVVVSPYVVNKSPDNYLKLIPMPCEQRRVYAAFFTLWQSNATSPNPQSLAFDLIVLSQQGPAITFRLEPANLDHKTRHGYDHIQLSKTLARRSVSLKDALSVLPTTYPAFPIPAKDPLTPIFDNGSRNARLSRRIRQCYSQGI